MNHPPKPLQFFSFTPQKFFPSEWLIMTLNNGFVEFKRIWTVFFAMRLAAVLHNPVTCYIIWLLFANIKVLSWYFKSLQKVFEHWRRTYKYLNINKLDNKIVINEKVFLWTLFTFWAIFECNFNEIMLRFYLFVNSLSNFLADSL